jgi:hypothetical protein
MISEKVETDPEHPGALAAQVIEQAAVAGPDVENASRIRRDLFEQDALSLGATGKVIRPFQVVINVLAGRPLLGVHGADYRQRPLGWPLFHKISSQSH